MPLYSYLCEKCLNSPDKYFKMGEAPQRIKCDKCGKLCVRVYNINVRVPTPTHEARKNRGQG